MGVSRGKGGKGVRRGGRGGGAGAGGVGRAAGRAACLLDRHLLVGLDLREAIAELEEVDRAVDRAGGDERALLLHLERVQPVVVDLERERRVVLLVEVVPHVERAVHLRREEDAGARRRPRGVEQVVLEVPE